MTMSITQEQLDAALADAQATIMESVHGAISGAMAKYTKTVDKRFTELTTPKEPDPKDSELETLKNQLTSLQQERESEKKEALAAKRAAAIAQEVSSRKVMAPKVLNKLLNSQFSESLEESEGGWQVEGKPLSSLVDEFLASEDGSVFTPPSTVKGTDASPGSPPPKPEPKGLSSYFVDSLKR